MYICESNFGKKTLAFIFPSNVGSTSLVHKSNAYFEDPCVSIAYFGNYCLKLE